LSITPPTLELYVEAGRLRYRLRGEPPTAPLLEFLSENKEVLVGLLTPSHQRNGTAAHPARLHASPTAAEPPGGDVQNGVHGPRAAEVPVPEGRETPRGWELIREQSELGTVLQAFDESGDVVGLDCETVGLDPLAGKVRLIQLATGRGTYLIDAFAVDPSPLWEALAVKTLVAHNGVFDVSMLAGRGFEPGAVRCTMLLSLLLHGPRKGKGFHGLEKTAERELGRAVSKAEQKSDWSAPSLSRGQLDYAAADAEVLVPLHDALMKRLTAAGQAGVVEIESRCLPAMAWVSRAGVPFDKDAWLALAEKSEQAAEALACRLDEMAPPRPGCLPGTRWNWRSHEQMRELFGLLGTGLESTDDDALAAVDHPLAQALREHRAADKEVTSYGRDWLRFVAADGRLRAEWRQLGCITGRMSCKKPALQTIPKDDARRRCFRAPEGRVLIRADYSQIELRIAAKVADEARMLAAYRGGEDLHTLTARKMTGRAEVTKRERDLAKPVNFGLIYGLSPKGLRRSARRDYGIDLSDEEAARYCRAFFEAWPGIKRWHDRLRRENPSEVRTLTGRRVPLGPKSFYGTAANYSVQGSGGDGLKRALALLWERRAECPGAFPVLVVHDEIVVEADADKAEAAAAWLKGAMLDGMKEILAPVPCEVEATVARTWGGG
jgi:DNA polymerase-1